MPAWIIYLVGVFVFGLTYGFLKQHVNEISLVIGALTYLAILSWVARKFGRKKS